MQQDYNQFVLEVKQTVMNNDYKIITQNNGLDLMISNSLNKEQKMNLIKETLSYYEYIEEYTRCAKLKSILDKFQE